MNGDYMLAMTPNVESATNWSTHFKNYCGGVEAFEVYAGSINSTYSEVFWTNLPEVWSANPSPNWMRSALSCPLLVTLRLSFTANRCHSRHRRGITSPRCKETVSHCVLDGRAESWRSLSSASPAEAWLWWASKPSGSGKRRRETPCPNPQPKPKLRPKLRLKATPHPCPGYSGRQGVAPGKRRPHMPPPRPVPAPGAEGGGIEGQRPCRAHLRFTCGSPPAIP